MTEPRPARIRIIEDDPALLAALLKVFSTRFDVRTAQNSEEATAQQVSWTPDVVLTDFMLPRLNGIDLAERLRATGYAGPIVLLTAAPQAAAVVSAEARRVVDRVFPKPCSLVELQRTLDALAAASPTRNLASE